VARPGFWKPLPLTAAVGGDSARFYARRFERTTVRADMATVGTGLLVVGGLFLTRPCRFAANCSVARLETSGGMKISGVVFGMVSKALHQNAESDAARALWWNNSRFSRP